LANPKEQTAPVVAAAVKEAVCTTVVAYTSGTKVEACSSGVQ
jgi:hypothetical protein